MQTAIGPGDGSASFEFRPLPSTEEERAAWLKEESAI